MTTRPKAPTNGQGLAEAGGATSGRTSLACEGRGGVRVGVSQDDA